MIVRYIFTTYQLNKMQVNTAYSLLRTLRAFCCENPGVLDTTSALVQLPPVGDERSPYQVPPHRLGRSPYYRCMD